MKTYLLERTQRIARSRAEVFDFFARAENLGRITPPWLHFRIRSALPIQMRVDARIDYTIRLAGVPLRWRTRITAWEPERRFVDVQERGPYALWEHTHLFEPRESGVLMTDRVRYALPLGWLGRATCALAVRSALASIFDYRYQSIRAILEESPRGGADD
ncbi:MAG: SRPBCC family protein [Deltaproteobacteria bacterium]|nr:SRPBCC family protein [Deltaproteobacteria bacterium]